MLPDERDAALLWEMHEAAADIVGFTRPLTYQEFAGSKMVRYAVERQLLVIGEAAKKICNRSQFSTD